MSEHDKDPSRPGEMVVVLGVLIALGILASIVGAIVAVLQYVKG